MTEIPQELIRYLAAHDRARNAEVDAVLEALNPREQALIKEAAVMGYVRGTLAGRTDEIPPDSAVLRGVIAACLAMPDLYPVLNAIREDTE